LALATLGQMSFQELGLALPDLIEQSMKLGYLPREALSMLESPDAYRTLFASIEPAIHHFEQTSVAGLYERVIAGIRSVDPDRIIFLEPTALVNAGAVSGLPLPSPPLFGPVAYLPHWYDLVLDTAIACEASKKRLGMAMDSRVQEAERMGLPLLIGEWGAFYNSPSCRDAGNMMAELLARNTVGDFYWDYHRNMEESPYRSALFRPAPIAVNGRGVRVELDFGQGTFRITWQEEQADRPASLIYVPAEWAPADILVDGRRLTGELAQLPYLKIEADPDRATREVLIRRKK
ncbi:MAG TPA: cellulase family glycosylhydrolase, partial [Candidatus Hydrogenedentes bacterium]|nr:cellulase family glycosylhydrolase [Candidatus Hydrogenedentota bacterium]